MTLTLSSHVPITVMGTWGHCYGIQSKQQAVTLCNHMGVPIQESEIITFHPVPTKNVLVSNLVRLGVQLLSERYYWLCPLLEKCDLTTLIPLNTGHETDVRVMSISSPLDVQILDISSTIWTSNHQRHWDIQHLN